METPNQENASPAVTNPPAQPVDANTDKPVHVMFEIRNLVKESLKTAGCEARDIIVANLHKEEIAKRTTALQKVMEKVEAAEGELRKIKPKALGKNLDGSAAGQLVYSDEDVKKYKEQSELLTKLHTAINRAIREHNFDKVFELSK
jgi:hypothetical protein